MVCARGAVQAVKCGFPTCWVCVGGACVAVCAPQGIRRQVCAEGVIENRKVERLADLSPELSEA
eukprot:2199602-Alexandrium_andersonii.AAC.1